MKIFQSLENTIFVFEDAHWIDSQSWIMLQMVLPQLAGTSMVMIVTRPPNIQSQMKGGGQAGTEGFNEISEEKIEEEYLEFYMQSSAAFYQIQWHMNRLLS